MQQINWDNLRYILMVANKGSIAAAARELGVNRTTVLRRIDTFQNNLKCRIFEQTSNGYTLTPEAEKMIAAAREVESTLYYMQREIEGRELKLEGEIRVTTTDTFMVSMLGPIVADFHFKNPKIIVDILVTNNVLDLDRRDADVAIRPTVTPDSHLVGRRLLDVQFGGYASPDYLHKMGDASWQDHHWIGLDISLRGSLPGKWFHENIRPDQVCLRADSFVTMKVAAENGLGVALLPGFLAEANSTLRRIDAPTDGFTVGLWILTHPDLIRSARVHAFVDHISTATANLDAHR